MNSMSQVYIRHINPGNIALEFIDSRILDDGYRGVHLSQHYRYDREEMVAILRLLDKYAPSKSLLPIRTTDLSKRPENLPEEFTYARFCNEVNETISKGTQDSIRKTLFVDFHRMGLINRYGPDSVPTRLFSRQRVKFVSLTEQGLRLVQAESIDEQYYTFSRAVDRLLLGIISAMLNLLRDPDFELKRVEIHEFMFFVSAIGTRTSFSIGNAKCVELIRAFRRLSPIQRRSVIDKLERELKPEHFHGDKTSQRDFRNWHNEAEQIYSLLDQTVYFEVREKTLYLRRSRVRSFGEKVRYFDNHRVSRVPGFELHHVIPLGWSESEEQFKLFDNWRNMVYINAFDHAIITQNRNRNVVMTANGADVILSDFSDNHVCLKNRDNIIYDVNKQPVMLDYNRRLLQVID